MQLRERPAFVVPLLRNILLLMVAFACFLVLLYPAHTLTLTAQKISSAKLSGFKSLSKPLRAADGTSYAWTNPQSVLYFLNINRTAPLKVSLVMDITRLSNLPANQVSVSELKGSQGHTVVNRAYFKPNPVQRGFDNYSFEVPPDLAADTALGLELVSQPLKIAELPMLVGVQLHRMQIEVTGNPYAYLVWPQPYLLAVLLLLVGLTYWCQRANLDWLETGLLLLPFSLVTAALMPFLLVWSWPLLALALLVIAMAASWQRRIAFDWRHHRFVTTSKPGFLLLPILVAGFALSLFVLFAPSFAFDTRLFMGWSHKVHLFGPFDSYHHIVDLDYPPLIVYILWIYGWLLAPADLIANVLALKIFMSICMVGVGVVIWLLGRPHFKGHPNLARVMVISSLSAGLLFNPAVWGQVDVLVGLMVLAAFWLVYRQHFLWAGAWLGLLLLFKPQAWILLPLLAVLIVKKAGWKRGMLAGIVGLVLTLALAIPAFGDFNAFLKFWTQPSLVGAAGKDADTGTLGAFNLLWLLGFDTKAATDDVTWLGLGLFTVIYLLVLARTIWHEASEQEVSLGAAVLLVAFFFLSIKMRERYLYYALPMLAWACLYHRKLIKPYLCLNLFCLVNTMHGYLQNNHHPLPTSFYLWPDLLQPIVFSWLTLGATLYLVWLYLQLFFNRPTRRWHSLRLKLPARIRPNRSPTQATFAENL